MVFALDTILIDIISEMAIRHSKLQDSEDRMLGSLFSLSSDIGVPSIDGILEAVGSIFAALFSLS